MREPTRSEMVKPLCCSSCRVPWAAQPQRTPALGRGGSQPLPGAVGIELRHALSNRLGLGAKILLMDHAVVIHNKGHDTGRSMLRGKGDQGEAANHLVADHIVVRAVWSILPLRLQDSVLVAVVGDRLPRRSLERVPFSPGLGDKGPQRAWAFPRSCLPLTPP